ncbi:hypothetical protein R1sor_006047 [Riccia sorocarpa]|uniref:N6-adenine methyltransferase n=1 Tax=Riccia sorocarpa TaxID=122646 RepID=A0ABD3HQI6_9MARC
MVCDASLPAHNAFVAHTREKWEFNQYWYSAHTIQVMAKEIEEVATKVAFLSTPSVYFSLTNGQLKKRSYFFDLDTQWAGFPNYVRWDYNQPLAIDESFHHSFDCVVIDPPFVTHEVWAKYAETALLLLSNGGKIILSTIRENAEILKRLLQVEPQVFQPSIPHLVYQYFLFANFPTKYLSVPNPEVP